jgi:hypothetical protein
MYVQIFTGLSTVGQFGFQVSSDNETNVTGFSNQFISMFPGFCPVVNRPDIFVCQKTEEIELRVTEFIDRYKENVPKIYEVHTFIKRQSNGAFFCILPYELTSQREQVAIVDLLNAFERNLDFDEVNKLTSQLFGAFLDSYHVFVYGPERARVGEHHRSKRICRFCKKDATKTSFKKKAHAISEALGNKNVVVLEECDRCNEKFGQTLERDIITYFSFYRTFYGVSGKEGVSSIEGKNFELFREPELTLKYYQTEDDPEEDDRSEIMNFRLKMHEQLSLQNIYKTLCKFFLSAVRNEFLPHFEETFKWINGEVLQLQLPKVGIWYSFDEFLTQPNILTVVRKSDDQEIPFAVGEFHFLFLRYVFILPCTNTDCFNYLSSDQFEVFLNTFIHYRDMPGMKWLDLSNSEVKPFEFNFRMAPNGSKT